MNLGLILFLFLFHGSNCYDNKCCKWLLSSVQDSINDLRACWEVQVNEISYLTKTLASKQSSNVSFKEKFCLLENVARV